MSGWRRYLLARAADRLSKAEPNLNLVPQVVELHSKVRVQLVELGVWAPFGIVLRLWWCAHCIERSVHHALRAEACRR